MCFEARIKRYDADEHQNYYNMQNEHMKMGKITPTIAIVQRGRSVKSISE